MGFIWDLDGRNMGFIWDLNMGFKYGIYMGSIWDLVGFM